MNQRISNLNEFNNENSINESINLSAKYALCRNNITWPEYGISLKSGMFYIDETWNNIKELEDKMRAQRKHTTSDERYCIIDLKETKDFIFKIKTCDIKPLKTGRGNEYSGVWR